ncbi:unnamed protein product [Thelazia callipaeda]|uniref:cyclic pyranopterin monophosphate synthase n=1 Tax=Thelazia callipaeda TaxID=103827 RepID=A0A0N5CQS8_THECL|nr:unnamed protein product [Thelazia callipaeda]
MPKRDLLSIATKSYRVLHSSQTNETLKKAPTALKMATSKEDNKLMDGYGRKHKYLRISLVEKCNLKCKYCMPKEGIKLCQKNDILRLDEIIRIATIFAQLGVKKIRLTGGEPTLRKDLVEIIENLSKISGIEHITMTTNGLAIRKKLELFARSGLHGVNISLDTLNPERYLYITGQKGFTDVLKTIESATNIFQIVKINNVVIRNFNDSEVPDFVAITKAKNIDVRFIEYMPFSGNNFAAEKLVPYKELLKILDKIFPQIVRLKDEQNSTSKSYKVEGFQGKFGFISSITDSFCSTCDRIRITADGNLKVCLHDRAEVSLRDIMRCGGTNDDIQKAIIKAIRQKKREHAGIKELMEFSNRNLLSGSQLYNIYCHCSKTFNHINDAGKAKMVDVSMKKVTLRKATAQCTVKITDEVMKALRENKVAKGDVLCVSRIAGIIAAKSTSTIIPLCHNIPLTAVQVEMDLLEEKNEVQIRSTVSTNSQTGVEMEALTAVSVSALTLYDMCKAITHEMTISNIQLLKKEGGKRTVEKIH